MDNKYNYYLIDWKGTEMTKFSEIIEIMEVTNV